MGVAPSQNRGPSVFWHGYFVLCSAAGISTGRCMPVYSEVLGLGTTVPLAQSVNGQMLTSVDTIESYVNSGFVTLFDTGAEFIGTISPTDEMIVPTTMPGPGKRRREESIIWLPPRGG